MNQEKTKRIQTVVTIETYARLQEIAIRQDMSLADFVRDALERRCNELGDTLSIKVEEWGGKRQGSGRKSSS